MKNDLQYLIIYIVAGSYYRRQFVSWKYMLINIHTSGNIFNVQKIRQLLTFETKYHDKN